MPVSLPMDKLVKSHDATDYSVLGVKVSSLVTRREPVIFSCSAVTSTFMLTLGGMLIQLQCMII